MEKKHKEKSSREFINIPQSVYNGVEDGTYRVVIKSFKLIYSKQGKAEEDRLLLTYEYEDGFNDTKAIFLSVTPNSLFVKLVSICSNKEPKKFYFDTLIDVELWITLKTASTYQNIVDFMPIYDDEDDDEPEFED